jgi:dethiobiotin synthase
MRGLFVTGTDTGIGKTVVSAALMAGAGPGVCYFKPVQTGDDDDTHTVPRLSQAPVTEPAYRLERPASPHHAAEEAGVSIRIDAILETMRPHDHRWVVEGAGGLLVPLSRQQLMPELIRALNLPVLVVSSTRLGTINHTLLTLHQLDALGLPILGTVLIGDDDPSANSGIGSHHPAPILARLPYLEQVDHGSVGAWGERLHRTPRIQEVLR